MDLQNYRIGLGLGEDFDGQPITSWQRDNLIRNIGGIAAHWFGGFTITHTQGGWVNPAGKLITEPGITLDLLVDEKSGAFANSSDSTLDDAVILFALHVGRISRQHSVVFIRPNGSARIIETGVA